VDIQKARTSYDLIARYERERSDARRLPSSAPTPFFLPHSAPPTSSG